MKVGWKILPHWIWDAEVLLCGITSNIPPENVCIFFFSNGDYFDLLHCCERFFIIVCSKLVSLWLK